MTTTETYAEPPPGSPRMDDPDDAHGPSTLPLETLAQLRARVAAKGPRRWLLKGIWPAGDYGVFAAPPKAQKTMTTADLAVSVAGNVPWLGLIDVETPGPVIMFVGEGGDEDTDRRLTATARSRGLDPDQLPIHVCVRAPQIGRSEHLHEIGVMLDRVRPALVTLDPLYLSAQGAELGDIYKMGALLHGPQLLCQRAGASLFVVHHFNRSTGTGAARMAGAGPQEWGRVLLSATVKSRRTDHETLASTVTTEVDIQGGAIPDQRIRIVRRIQADDPDNLDSPLTIETTATRAEDDSPSASHDPADDTATAETNLKPSQRRLLKALEALDAPATITELGDWMALNDAPPLRRETCSKALNELATLDLVDSIPSEQRFGSNQWLLVPRDQRDVTRDGHTEPSRVTRVTAPIGGHASHDDTSHEHTTTTTDHTTDQELSA